MRVLEFYYRYLLSSCLRARFGSSRCWICWEREYIDACLFVCFLNFFVLFCFVLKLVDVLQVFRISFYTLYLLVAICYCSILPRFYSTVHIIETGSKIFLHPLNFLDVNFGIGSNRNRKYCQPMNEPNRTLWSTYSFPSPYRINS